MATACAVRGLWPIVSLIAILASSSLGQSINWTEQVGTDAYDSPWAAAHDRSGGVYVVGDTYGPMGTYFGDSDAWIGRWNRSGDRLWVHQIGTADVEQPFAVACDDAGRVFWGGYTTGSLFPPTTTFQNNWIQCLSSDGVVMWNVQFGVSGGIIGVRDLEPTQAGDLLALDANFVHLFSSVGVAVWSTPIAVTPFLSATKITGDGVGGAFVCGDTSISLNGQPIAGGYDAFVAHISSTGTLLWTRILGSSAFDNATGIATSPNGPIWVVGTTTGSLGAPTMGLHDAWVGKLDRSGNVLDVVQFGTSANDYANSVAWTNGGSIAVGGDTSGSLAGSAAGLNDAWVVNLDSSGSITWGHQFGTSGQDRIFDLASDGPLRLYAVGNTYGNLAAASNGDCDAWISQISMACYVDADLDGYGAGAPVASVPPCGAGHSSRDDDCDDTNALVYPGASDTCDGIDNDCDGVIDEGFISTYCTAGTTVAGCVPAIRGEGAPSSQATSGFDIVVDNVPTQKMGLIFYGLSSIPSPQPWALGSTSYLCIFYPVNRTGARNSGGSVGACDGELRIDFNAWRTANPTALGSPFAAGQVLYAQGWFRDAGAAKGTNLSDGLRFVLCD